MLRNLFTFFTCFLYLLGVAVIGHELMGAGGEILFAAIGPTTLTDPGIIKRWKKLSKDAYWAAVYKSALSDPQYTGTKRAKRSIEKRGDMLGAPFVEYYDLKKMKGTTLTDSVHIPPFEGDEEVLFGTGDDIGYVRVKGQNRVGFEIQASRKNITFPLQNYFFSAFEEDVRMSEQETGGSLLSLLVSHITDLKGRYTDADRLFTFHQGFSPHLYTRAAQADATVSDGDPAPSNSEMSLLAPFEHPNTYAFVNTGSLADPVYKLLAANDVADATADTYTATNWTGKVHETVGQVTSSALPGRKMLDLTVEEIRRLRIVPVRYRMKNGKSKAYYIVLVSPAMMNMFLDDPDLEKRFGDAFSGHMYDHPMINDDDKIYRCLILREEEKLDQKVHTYAYNFGGDYDYGTTADGGLDARASLAAGIDAGTVTVTKDTSTGGAGAGRDQRVKLTYTERIFRQYKDGGSTTNLTSGSAAESQPAGNDSAIGPDGGDKIDRIIVFGASACGFVPGPVFQLDRRKEDDYGNILGLGSESFGGGRRIEWATTKSHASGYDNQGSLVIAAYNGK